MPQLAKPYAGQAAVPAAQRRLFLVFFAPDTFAIIYLLELLYRCMRVEPQKWYVTREPIDHRNWHLAGLSKTKRKDKTYVRNNILSAAFSGPRSFQLSDREYSRSVELAYPGVKAACDVTFDEMWTLFLDSGFLYPEKVSRLQPVMREIQNTVRSLLKANGNPMATVVVRNEQALDAQISMLRWYDKTWMVQHLAALPLSARARHSRDGPLWPGATRHSLGQDVLSAEQRLAFACLRWFCQARQRSAKVRPSRLPLPGGGDGRFFPRGPQSGSGTPGRRK